MDSEIGTKLHKKPVNLTLSSDLPGEAKQLDIDVSAVLERSLTHEVTGLNGRAWLEENQDTIEAYNREVESQGVFSDSLRSF